LHCKTTFTLPRLRHAFVRRANSEIVMRAQELEVLARSPRLFLRSNSNLILYTERGSRRAHVRPWHHFTRILQTKAEPGPSHSGSGRHSCAVGLARIYLTRRSARPSRLGHSRGDRRRDPLCCDLGGHTLLVPTEARQAAYADTAGACPLSRERRKKSFSLRRRNERGNPTTRL